MANPSALTLTRRDGEAVRLKTPDGTIIWVEFILTESSPGQPPNTRVRFIVPGGRDAADIAREELLAEEEQREATNCLMPY